MPVTAKLSKAFYDRFGEDIVTELVELLNLVDANYRSELRELNEVNFARFDAKLEQRIAQLDAKFEQRIAQLDVKVERLIAQLETKFDKRVTEVESRLVIKIDTGLAALRSDLLGKLQEQTRFLYLAWAAVIAAVFLAR